jgi:peptidoglycan/xylan/chitin deacetylase (PgdA/CDA1 family)
MNLRRRKVFICLLVVFAAAIATYFHDSEERLLVSRLAKLLNHTNAGVRLRVAELLTRSERQNMLCLARAASDEDQAVRRLAQEAIAKLDLETRDGAIIRGPKAEKEIALIFTGHEFAEGGSTILSELARHNAKASFFLTGNFLTNNRFNALIQRMVSEGHYLGPHSDKHLLYCPWEGPKRTLVTHEEFHRDFGENLRKLHLFYYRDLACRYFLPPYEHYNLQIADWAGETDYQLINYTPGTRSNADYTGEAEQNFVSSKSIFDSIMAKEQQDPHGLNGFFLLLHVGSGPGRADKFHLRYFGELLDYLVARNYKMVAMDEMLEPEAAQKQRRLDAAIPRRHAVPPLAPIQPKPTAQPGTN